MKAHKTNIPDTSLVNKYFPADYTDAFMCGPVKTGAFTPDDVMVSFWTDFPAWVNGLFKLRNFLVKFVGLKNEQNSFVKFEDCIRTGGKLDFVSVPAKNENETVVLLTDKHLNAYLSIHFDRKKSYINITAITLVHFHNTLGKVYFFFIKPFHAIIVKEILKRVVKKL